MSFIRPLLAGLAAAAIAGPAFAQACLPAAERSALDIRALQSQLMVVALTCGQHDDYNRFVTQHQGALRNAFNGVRGHFSRTGGGQRQLDTYITNLANAHAQEGVRQGSHFCQNAQGLFQQALAPQDARGLAALSAQHAIVNPIGTPACAAPTTVQASRPRAPQPTQTAAR